MTNYEIKEVSASYNKQINPQTTSAILFIIFNRPNVTAQVFEAIRQASPPRLYISADGPRNGRDDDVTKCKEARRIATTIDWPCEVKTLFHENNLGCKKAVSHAITWFFDNEEQGIILEDDCLPDKEFFRYCDFYLELFNKSENIYAISGSRFGKSTESYLGKYSLMWGWASWRNKWAKYSYNLIKSDQVCNDVFKKTSTRLYWKDIFRATNSGLIDTWDYQWIYCVLSNNGLVVRPNYNLINNLGFSNEATHTFDSNLGRKLNSFKKTELSLSKNVEYNTNIDKEDEYHWLGLSRYRRLKIIIKYLLQKTTTLINAKNKNQ